MTRQSIPHPGLIVATTLGVFSLLVGGAFVVRTRSVAGPVVRDQLTDWATRHEAALQIDSMRPTGMFGIRLDGVSLRLARGPVTVGLESGTLEVRPSLSALAGGRAAVGHVRLRGGEIWMAPRRRSPTRSSAASSDPSPETDDPPSAPSPEPPSTRRISVPVEVEFDNVDVRLRGGGLAGEPIRIRKAELEIGATDRPLGLARLSGYGTFPGDIPFSLSTAPGPEGDAAAAPLDVTVSASRPVGLSELVGLEWPADLSAERAQVCPMCETPRVCLETLALRAGDYELQSPQACGRRRDGSVSIRAGEFDIFHRGRGSPFRLTEFRVDLFGHPHPFTLETTLDGGDRGRAELRSRFDPTRRVLVSTFETDRLQTTEFWPHPGLDDAITGGIVDGTATLELFPLSRMAALSGDIGIREATLHHPFVDRRPLRIESTRLHLEALTDFRLRHVSLADTRLALGGLEPVHLTGYLSRADPGLAVEFSAEATGLDAPQVRDALPETLATPARGAEMSGTFDLGLRTSGHTAYPESLLLEVDIGGDVEVLREGPRADVPSLASDGPPAPFLPMLKGADIPLSQWVNLESLDGTLPRILIAAEDARFYRHDGFDWRGIRNAMVHNLREGRLERGGSTITQQVAKNLFLSHDRTLGRKIKELWIAWRLESDLDKDRILELYVNLVHWGPGVQGLDQAARHYFDTPPDQLTLPQMVLLSAIVPGPHLYGPLIDRGYLPSSRVEKIEHILSNLRYVDLIDQRDYERIYTSATWGRIGGLDLTVCRDDDTAPEGAPRCPSS